MTDVDAVDYLRTQLGQGHTADDVAAALNHAHARLDGVPQKWTRSNVTHLAGQIGADRTITLQRDVDGAALTPTTTRALSDHDEGPQAVEISEQQFRRVVVFWIRVIGWIALISALLSLVAGIWIGAQWAGDQNTDDEVSSPASLNDETSAALRFQDRESCLDDSDTTYEECASAFPF